jgi:hypothetical protein
MKEKEVIEDVPTKIAHGDHPEGAVNLEVGRITSRCARGWRNGAAETIAVLAAGETEQLRPSLSLGAGFALGNRSQSYDRW